MSHGKRPHKVGLIAHEGDPLGLVLDDLAEAGAVYESLGGVETPIEFVRLSPAEDASGCDALVVACTSAKAAAASHEDQRVYTASSSDQGADLYIPHPERLPRLMKKPRLGMLRRGLSKQIDALIRRIQVGD